MKLYTYFRSSAAFRVRIALNLKGLEYESIPKWFASNEHRAVDYLALNPQGLIPALAVDDGTVLSQSLAIIEYLDEKYPTPALLPSDSIDRARVRSMALAIACEIHPLNNLRVLNYLRGSLGHSDDAVATWYCHWVIEGFEGLEAQARTYSHRGRHCYGDELTLADVCLVPQMFNARRFRVDPSSFPTLTAIAAHLESLPAYVSASPGEQADGI